MDAVELYQLCVRSRPKIPTIYLERVANCLVICGIMLVPSILFIQLSIFTLASSLFIIFTTVFSYVVFLIFVFLFLALITSQLEFLFFVIKGSFISRNAFQQRLYLCRTNLKVSDALHLKNNNKELMKLFDDQFQWISRSILMKENEKISQI